MALPIGFLWDSVSNNFGDQAIGEVGQAFLKSRNIPFETINPYAVHPETVSKIMIGGGELLRRLGDPFYDQFRIPGRHVLNAVGTHEADALEYLSAYRLISVRSQHDKEVLAQFVDANRIAIVPDTTILYDEFFPECKPHRLARDGQYKIGIHVNAAAIKSLPGFFPFLEQLKSIPQYRVRLIPFTIYQNDRYFIDLIDRTIGGIEICPCEDPANTYREIGDLDVLLSASLHACIFAYTQNVPVLAYPVYPKIEYFFSDRGLTNSLFRKTEPLIDQIDAVLQQPPDYSQLVDRDRATIRQHLDQVAEFLVDPSTTDEPDSDPSFRKIIHSPAQIHHTFTMEMTTQSAKNEIDQAIHEYVQANQVKQEDLRIEQAEARASAAETTLAVREEEWNQQQQKLIQETAEREQAIRLELERLQSELAKQELAAQLEVEKLQSEENRHELNLQSQITRLQQDLSDIQNSRGWRTLNRLHAARLKLLPPESRRDRFVRQVVKVILPMQMKTGNSQDANRILLSNSGLFDADWYCAQYPDVAKSEVDPLTHYLIYGGQEGRNPSPLFDSSAYIRVYPDVRKSKINPLLHYIKYGQKEGRKVLPVGQTPTPQSVKLTPETRLLQTKPRAEFRFHLDTDISKPFPVGKGTILHLEGWCYHPQLTLHALYLVVNEQLVQVQNHSFARYDILEAMAQVDVSGNSLMSGFVCGLPVEMVSTETEISLDLRAIFQDGSVETVPLAKLTLIPDAWQRIEAPVTDLVDEPLVAICMATYNPPLALFKKQIDSLKAQTHKRWVCIINDDASSPEIYAQVCALVKDDPRFAVFQNHTRIGLYHNFETCLTRVPKEATFVAFCDQDDFWYPEKLSSSLAAFRDSSVQLVYCDMDLVDEHGKTLAHTYWTNRANNYTSFETLLFANTVTGAASVFRSELLTDILPFPVRIADAYHDHWVACVAMCRGRIDYIDTPLYAYTQHSSNAFGHHKIETVRLFPEARRLLNWLRAPAGMKTELAPILKQLDTVYFQYLMRLVLIARILLLRLSGIDPKKISFLKQVSTFDRSIFGLLVQGLKYKLNHRPTLGYEWQALRAYIGHRMTVSYYAANRENLLKKQLAGPAAPAFSGPMILSDTKQVEVNATGMVQLLQKMIAPLDLRVDMAAVARINLVMATINFKYIYGGYLGMFQFAKKLTQQGHHVRIVIVEPCDYDPTSWKIDIQAYPGLEDLFDIVETSYHNDRSIALETSPSDVFIATSCWTAQIVHRSLQTIGKQEFIYFAQEYEPIFFPNGSFSALAAETYDFPQYTLFSTDLLQEYFRKSKLGVYRQDDAFGDDRSAYFRNAINASAISEDSLAQRKRKKLLYYARPEHHAARNMFELGIMGISAAIRSGLFNLDEWEFEGIGSLGPVSQMDLGCGATMRLMPKVSLNEYLKILSEYDLGISLMLSPHPSLMPIEMAAAGMLAVTNSFENKSAETLSAISPNIIAAMPTVEGICDAIGQALLRIEDYTGRVDGARVDWPTSWEQAFQPALIEKLNGWIDAIRAGNSLSEAPSESISQQKTTVSRQSTDSNEIKQYLLQLCDLKPDDAILEVGCGCGRMAIPLAGYLSERGGYDGFDIDQQCISLAQQEVTSRYPNFKFVHANVYNQYYNPNGLYAPEEYRFPYADNQFDVVFLTSVFTHMLPPEMKNYLAEIARVVKPGGKCFITCFLMNPESLELTQNDPGALKIINQANGYWTSNPKAPEEAIGFDETSLRDLFSENTLDIEAIHYGRWCNRSEFFSYQDIIIARKKSRPNNSHDLP